MTARDGWIPGPVRIARSHKDSPAVAPSYVEEDGETKGPFGMYRARWVWVVTHLPTGMAVADFERKVDAKRFCRWIAPLTDWEALDGKMRMPDGIRREVRRAMDECNAAYLVRIV